MTSISHNQNNSFSIQIKQDTYSAKIKMMVLRAPVNTVDIPGTFSILKKFLPSVLTTECFNDESIPFHKEVKKTEIGHLFEHILLEYMCRLKIAKGHRSAVYEGRTRWNWERDPWGLFHIHINCPLKDADILPLALNKSIELLKMILNNEYQNSMYTGKFVFDYNRQENKNLGLKNGKNRG